MIFFSRKLMDGKHNYTTTERELLAMAEILKKFRTILISQKIKICTGNKNSIFSNFTTERTMRLRILLDENNPELVCNKRPDNKVADLLSRLDLIPEKESPTSNLNYFNDYILNSKNYLKILTLSDKCWSKESKKRTPYCMIYKFIDYHKVFLGVGKECKSGHYKGKINVPKCLQHRIVKLCHTHFMHNGINGAEMIIRQHFTWSSPTEDMKKIVGTCLTCPLNKKGNKRKLGHLPLKKAEA